MTDLKDVVLTIHENFPDDRHILQATLTSLATISCLLLDDLPHCIGIIFVGPPSSAKTISLDFLDGSSMIHWTDKFTPRSFVSHSAQHSEEQLTSIDLLPKIAQKSIVIPELAPIFRARREDLVENFAILTRVFDGRGLQSESGVHGHRGYSGDYRFVLLGATTPLPNRAWEEMGKLGARLMFLDMTREPRTPEELAKMLTSGSVREKIKRCSESVIAFLKQLWESNGGFGGVEWNRANDDTDLLVEIGELAHIVARWRGVIQSSGGSGHNPPLVEMPERLTDTFYCLARGFALVYGRTVLEKQDIEMIKPIAYSSMPEDRRRIFESLSVRVRISTRDVADLLDCSTPTATKVMEELELLGVVKLSRTSQGFWMELV